MISYLFAYQTKTTIIHTTHRQEHCPQNAPLQRRQQRRGQDRGWCLRSSPNFWRVSINTLSLSINYKQSNATIIIKSLTPGRFDSLMLHSLNANLTQDHILWFDLSLKSDGKANNPNITKRTTKRRRLTSIEKSLIVAALTVEGSKVIDPLYFTTGWLLINSFSIR